MDFFVWLPIIMRVIELAPKVTAALNAKQSVNDLVKGLAPDLLPVIKEVGAKLFPTLDPAAQVEAGALATFGIERIKWVQKSLNDLVGSTLVVDGTLGDKTKAVVKTFQSANGLDPDGWPGHLTCDVIQAKLAAA
jgi:peptidoglycan hydrolase-like protein with peptidoglycan-binding domain